VSARRSYREFCGVAKALDVVGERWTLLIVRNLLVGGQRYKDLLESLPGITTNLLAARLRGLTEAGLISQRTLPPPAASVVYELSPAGRELEPVILALGNFGARYLGAKKRGDQTHPRWMMVALKRRYQGSRRSFSLALEIDGQHAFRLQLGARSLEIDSGAGTAPVDASVRLASASMRALLFEGASARALLDTQDIVLTGDRDAFLQLAHAVGATG
jgi:DNA-binding HxlR family transcriptional regulator